MKRRVHGMVKIRDLYHPLVPCLFHRQPTCDGSQKRKEMQGIWISSSLAPCGDAGEVTGDGRSTQR